MEESKQVNIGTFYPQTASVYLNSENQYIFITIPQWANNSWAFDYILAKNKKIRVTDMSRLHYFFSLIKTRSRLFVRLTCFSFPWNYLSKLETYQRQTQWKQYPVSNIRGRLFFPSFHTSSVPPSPAILSSSAASPLPLHISPHSHYPSFHPVPSPTFPSLPSFPMLLSHHASSPFSSCFHLFPNALFPFSFIFTPSLPHLSSSLLPFSSLSLFPLQPFIPAGLSHHPLSPSSSLHFPPTPFVSLLLFFLSPSLTSFITLPGSLPHPSFFSPLPVSSFLPSSTLPSLCLPSPPCNPSSSLLPPSGHWATFESREKQRRHVIGPRVTSRKIRSHAGHNGTIHFRTLKSLPSCGRTHDPKRLLNLPWPDLSYHHSLHEYYKSW